MTTVRVAPGTCGFVTTVRAEAAGRRRVRVSLESDCEAVRELGRRLEELDLRQVVGAGFGQGPVFAAGRESLKHASCPVVSGLLKAAEVALGLNLPREARISFLEDEA